MLSKDYKEYKHNRNQLYKYKKDYLFIKLSNSKNNDRVYKTEKLHRRKIMKKKIIIIILIVVILILIIIGTENLIYHDT